MTLPKNQLWHLKITSSEKKFMKGTDQKKTEKSPVLSNI